MEKGILGYVGRDYEKCNCFDLVKEFYKNELGVDLTNYWESESIPSRLDRQTLITASKGNFEKVEVPKFGDIIVVNLYGMACHLGVYIDHKIILHSLRKIGSCLEPTNKYARMIEGYYRYRAIG